MTHSPKLLTRLTSVLILSLSASLAIAVDSQPNTSNLEPRKDEKPPLRVLHIGNSFSLNATHFLPQLAEAGSKKLEIFGCVIAGSSFQLHASHLKKAKEGKGGDPYKTSKSFSTKEQISLPEALALRPWDVVTIQQVSSGSFRPESYEPYASEVIAEVRTSAPTATLYIHQTWAYRADHPLFERSSDLNPERMQELANVAYQQLGQRHNITHFLPSGLAVQMAAQSDEWKHQRDPDFDYTQLEKQRLPKEKSLYVGPISITPRKDGTLKLNSDGSHLGPAGCYLAACVWYEVLFNDSVLNVDFTPKLLTPKEAASLRKIAHEAVDAYRRHGLSGSASSFKKTPMQ